jgi:excisionase family DNA binding protein
MTPVSAGDAGPPLHLSFKQAAECLGTGTWFVRHEVARGNLPSVRLSCRAVRISVEDLQAYLASRRRIEPRPLASWPAKLNDRKLICDAMYVFAITRRNSF